MAFWISQPSFIAINAILGIGFFAGLPLNVIVILTILTTPSLRDRLTNLLIVNLCFTDLITVLLDIPFIWKILFVNHEQDQASLTNSGLFCDIQVFCHALGIAAQATALVTIAYERYHSIASPFKKNQIRQRSLLFAAICWLSAIALAIIQLTLAKPTITFDICSLTVEVYHSSTKYVIVAYGSTAFLIIVIYYIGILYLVKKHLHKFDQKVTLNTSQPMVSASTNGNTVATVKTRSPEDDQIMDIKPVPTEDCQPPIFGAVCERNDTNREKGKRKFEAEIAKRLFYIIASFIIVWMPYASLVILITEFDFVIRTKEVTFEILFCLHILTTLAACLNPLIYALPNQQFRSTLRHYLWLKKTDSSFC